MISVELKEMEVAISLWWNDDLLLLIHLVKLRHKLIQMKATMIETNKLCPCYMTILKGIGQGEGYIQGKICQNHLSFIVVH